MSLPAAPSPSFSCRRAPRAAAACGAAALALLAGCSAPEPLVGGPLTARPVAPPASLEHTATGSIYHAGARNASLFTDDKVPSSIGDTIKVDISESLNASNTVSTDTSRSNSVKSVGPGAKNLTGALGSLADMNASASGSDSFTGKGTGSNTSAFTGRLAASVINVLPNGNLEVAGERAVAFNGGTTTLRLHGVVNPRDIKSGGVVASGDMADFKLEMVGNGGAADAQEKSWLQKLLTGTLSVW